MTRSLRPICFAILAMSLAGCHPGGEPAPGEALAPQRSALSEPGGDADDAELVLDVVGRYRADTQVVILVDGWQPVVAEMAGLVLLDDGTAVFAESGLQVEVVVISEDQLPDVIAPEDLKKAGITVYKDRKCTPWLQDEQECSAASGRVETDDGAIVDFLSAEYITHDVHTCTSDPGSLCMERRGIGFEAHYYAGPNCTGQKLQIHTTTYGMCNL